MEFKTIPDLVIAVTFTLVVSVLVPAQNPTPPAAGPQTGKQKVRVCCLSPDELAALQTKAERGDVSAQKTMADYYDYKIRNSDSEDAVDDADVASYLKWLRKAAEGGDVESQRSLGSDYDRGISGPKNVAEGRKWLRKAASQGSEAGMEGLCVSYTNEMEMSKGVDANQFPLPMVNSSKQNLTEVFNWCSQAANTGRPTSTYLLALLYARGSADTKPDYEQAYFWLRVRRQGTRELRDAVANQLTAERRMETEKRAALWKPKQTPN